MTKFTISATLGITNPTINKSVPDPTGYIVKGTTANLSLDLNETPYTFNQIKQVVFVLKQPSGKMMTYSLYNEEHEIEDHFEYMKGSSFNYLKFTFSPEETSKLEETTSDSLLEVESAITINKVDGTSYTYVEKIGYYEVQASLFGQVLGDK